MDRYDEYISKVRKNFPEFSLASDEDILYNTIRNFDPVSRTGFWVHQNILKKLIDTGEYEVYKYSEPPVLNDAFYRLQFGATQSSPYSFSSGMVYITDSSVQVLVSICNGLENYVLSIGKCDLDVDD